MNTPKKGIAVILALFFGGIGIHKFYMGDTKSGLIRLLFSWTFIPAIIALIEVFYYAFMSDKKWKEKYHREY